METSDSKFIENSQIILETNEDNRDENFVQDINQLTCCLKNAIFSKYILNYLIEKIEKVYN